MDNDLLNGPSHLWSPSCNRLLGRFFTILDKWFHFLFLFSPFYGLFSILSFSSISFSKFTNLYSSMYIASIDLWCHFRELCKKSRVFYNFLQNGSMLLILGNLKSLISILWTFLGKFQQFPFDHEPWKANGMTLSFRLVAHIMGDKSSY